MYRWCGMSPTRALFSRPVSLQEPTMQMKLFPWINVQTRQCSEKIA